MVDEAVGMYGRWVEGMLAQREAVTNDKGLVIGHKPIYRLDVLLGIESKPKLPGPHELIAAMGGGRG